MYTTVTELQRCTVSGVDGDAGTVSDVLFDDARWRVRYVVAATGRWLHHHRVLLPPATLGRLHPEVHSLDVSLTNDEIAHGQPIDADPPVSARMEHQLRDVIALASCWVAGFGEPCIVPPAMLLATAKPSAAEDPHLRSASRVLGHHVMSEDGVVGSVEDFVIDNDGWSVRDLVVQTGGWLHHRNVLVSPRWVRQISWAMRTVRIELLRDGFERAAGIDALA